MLKKLQLLNALQISWLKLPSQEIILKTVLLFIQEVSSEMVIFTC